MTRPQARQLGAVPQRNSTTARPRVTRETGRAAGWPAEAPGRPGGVCPHPGHVSPPCYQPLHLYDALSTRFSTKHKLGRDMSQQKPKLTAPTGLGTEGRKLWRKLTEGYDFTDCQERLPTVEMACRTLDLVQRLQADVDALETLRTRGSAGQQVAAPEVGMLVQTRAQYVVLMKSLMLSEADVPEEGSDRRSGPMSRSESARIAARARWQRSAG